MRRSDENRFRARPGKPRQERDPGVQRFTRQVLRAARKAGAGAGPALRRASGRGAEKGRGLVAARLVSDRLGARARRVVVKARLVVHARAAPGTTAAHLRYIQRDSVTREGERGQLYTADRDAADGDAFERRAAGDRHEFRFIVSPEDAAELGDLRGYTRDLMARMEADLGTRLYEGFGLNARQIEMIARATPKRDYYVQSRAGNRLFDLGLGPVALAFVAASTPADHAMIDDVLTATGPAHFASSWLVARDLAWAADLVPAPSTFKENDR